MILVDTSVWIDHISASDPMLTSLLVEERVLAHPYVIGEISLGSLRDREIILGALRDLPRAPVAMPEETFYMIEGERNVWPCCPTRARSDMPALHPRRSA